MALLVKSLELARTKVRRLLIHADDKYYTAMAHLESNTAARRNFLVCFEALQTLRRAPNEPHNFVI